MTIKHSNVGWHKPLAYIKRSLSLRQLEVADLVTEGYTNIEIANILNVNIGTVKNHIMIICYKLNLRNRTQIAIWNYKRKQSEKISISNNNNCHINV